MIVNSASSPSAASAFTEICTGTASVLRGCVGGVAVDPKPNIPLDLASTSGGRRGPIELLSGSLDELVGRPHVAVVEGELMALVL